MIIIASLPGANEQVVNQAIALGATVRYRDDDVDYLRIKVPIERVEEIARLREIQALSLDGSPFYNTSATEEIAQETASPYKAAPPDRNTPAENPYLPTRDIGAPQFIARHPTFDGRGVTIANFDGMVPDMLSPELQTAMTLDGKPTRKIVDVINPLDPIDDDIPLKVKMTDIVTPRGRRFTYQGNTYISPADRQYRLGFFDTAKAFANGLLKKYLKSGNPTSNSDLLAVLWDEQTNIVWVDTNQNGSFADEKAMTDYNLHYDVGIIGKDDPTTLLRETVAFFLLPDMQNKFIHLVPLVYGHATSTTSVAAGRGFFGGKMNGVAPGAQIVTMMFAHLNHVLIEGMILAMKHPKIDLVTVQIGDSVLLNDGSSTLNVIWDRLVDKFKKPVFVSAGNGPLGINAVSSNSAGSKVISVGGYINKDTWLSNYAITATYDDYISNGSCRGPRKDGGFKPDIVTPRAVVAADFETYVSAGHNPFTVPPGYSAAAGTSQAAPMAAGAAALLISAAKQTGVLYDAERLRWALKSSARYLPHYGAYEQGAGLINVAAAWEALKHAPVPVTISSRAPVNTVTSRYLRQPYQGTGIYEREGWAVGQSANRTITFMRTSGEAKPITYAVRWTGNDGTFSSSTTINLPLNTPVEFPVTVNPKTPGVHSAILNLNEPDGARAIYQVMNTVVAAEQFKADNGYNITREGQAEYPGYTSYFFNVLNETSAFKIVLKVTSGNMRLLLMEPSGKELDGYHRIPAGRRADYQIGGTLSRTIINPEPGVWQVIVENGDLAIKGERLSLLLKANFTLTATILGVKAEPVFLELSFPQPNEGFIKEVSLTNYLSAFAGTVANAPLGSAFSATPVLNEGGAPQIYDIDVPPGTTTLAAHIAGASDGQADLDLYLYDCSGKECALKGIGIGDGAQESVTVVGPNAGKWKVVIDPVSIPTGKTSIEYTDILTHPVFGTLKSLDTTAPHESGAKWEERVSVQVSAMPTGNRRLMGVITVTSEKPNTVGHIYNASTKKADPLQRFAPLGTAFIEIRKGLKKN